MALIKNDPGPYFRIDGLFDVMERNIATIRRLDGYITGIRTGPMINLVFVSERVPKINA